MQLHQSSRLLQVFLLAVAFNLVAGAEKLRFKYSQTSEILLSWDKTWEVGAPNMMAFLKTDEQLTIKVAVEGKAGIAYKPILGFKCSQGMSSFSVMDLTTVTSTSSEKQCSTQIPFSVRTTNAELGEYEFTLLSSPLTFNYAFQEKLELRVTVESSVGTIESNSLFVWNLDIFSQMNSEPVSGKGYIRRFLTNEAIEFLKKMDVSSSPAFGSVRFLDPQVQMLLAAAPDFFRAKLNLGAVLNFDAGRCEYFQISRAALFVNYDSVLNIKGHNLLKHMYLNLDTGMLHYSSYGLSTFIADLFSARRPSRIGICSTLSFAGPSLPYHRTFPVEQKIPTDALSYKSAGNKDAGCQIPNNIGSKPITIFAGMDFTPLVCPIICSDPNQVYRFTYISDDHKELSLIPDSRRDFTFVNGIKIYKTGNIIEFPPTTQNRHAGSYRCEAGDKQFTFNAQVITMPHFTSQSVWTRTTGVEVSGNLPPVIYAMEGESMRYSCTVYFGNIDSVVMKAETYTPSEIGSIDVWRKLSVSDFNKLISDSATNFLTVSTNNNLSGARTLTAHVLNVPPARSSVGVNFTHRFVCSASVSAADANKIGMPSYNVESGSNVFFIDRPTLDSFDLSGARNCSAQICSATDGAEFVVSLKPSLTAYLKAIGVEVVGLFKIDDVYLKDLNILNQKGVSEIAFDNATNRLSFKVLPTTDDKVLEELQKRKLLTPVFNLRYPKSANIDGLQLLRDRYGSSDEAAGDRDCRADPRCFYSTEYDIGGSLQGLPMTIDFQTERPGPDQWNWIWMFMISIFGIV